MHKVFSVSEDSKMSKKIALITGGMGGLGTAICKGLADDGCTVVAYCLPGFPQMAE